MNKDIYKEVASLIAHANESLPVDEPIAMSVVTEVADRARVDGDDPVDRVTSFLSASIGESFSHEQDLDLLPDGYVGKFTSVEEKLESLKAYIPEARISLIASALDPKLTDVENIHAWKRLEILKNTGQISEELYNLTIRLERKVAETNEL